MKRSYVPFLVAAGLASALSLVVAVSASRADEPPPEREPEPAPQPEPESLTWKINAGTLPCGGSRDVVFTNSRSVAVQAKLTLSCDCGDGAFATVPTWGENITEKDNCEVRSGAKEGCVVDVPAGAKLGIACNNDKVDEDKRKGSGCTYIGVVESK